MANLLNDRRPRKLFTTNNNNLNAPVLVKDANFFSKRNKDLTSKAEFSELVFNEFITKYTNRNIFVISTSVDSWLWEALKDKNLNCIHPLSWNPETRGYDMDNVLGTLKSNGVRFNNKGRTASLINIENYVLDNSLIVVEGNDYSKLGITPDKELSFEDMWKKRSRRGWV